MGKVLRKRVLVKGTADGEFYVYSSEAVYVNVPSNLPLCVERPDWTCRKGSGKMKEGI
jgi:hypothetical protein